MGRSVARALLAGLAGTLAAGPALAAGQGDVAITIYTNDLALIEDVRPIDLPAARASVAFPEVSARIRPETVTIAAPDAAIVEQNFDYDLLSPARLLDKAVGQEVTLVRTNPATGAETREPARVLANNGGTLLQVGDRIEVLGENSNARLVFSSLPPGLKASPTLSVTLDSRRGGRRPVALSYLSNGFSWKADYVALFDEGAGTIDVEGWITLHNTSGTPFANAKVLLVAGQVGAGNDGGDDDAQPRWQPPSPVMPGNAPGIESAGRERLGDFYVYPIAGRTTLANDQQKQVSFLDVKGAPAARAYVFRNAWLGSADQAQGADTVLRFSTARTAGLGDALPAGTVRVYMRDARGQAQFIGENAIAHTPMGSSLAIHTGAAFDVKVQPTIESRQKIDSGTWEQSARWRISGDGPARVVSVDQAVPCWRTTMRYHLTNAKPQPVVVEVVQAGLDNGWRDTRVPMESIKGEQRGADVRVWQVPVPANGEATLTVSFDTRY